MGRPVNGRYFGSTNTHSIKVSAWTEFDTAAVNGFITRQNSDDRFLATTAEGSSLCKLVNTAPAAAGQMTIKVFPVESASGSGATFNVHLKLLSAAIATAGTGYTVNDVLTISTGTKVTPATITVNTVNGSGVIETFTVNNVANQGYTVLPQLVSSPTTGGTGSGASFNLTFELESIAVVSGGSNYAATPTVVISQSGSTVQPTATATEVGGVITAITITNPGTGFTSIPTLALTAPSVTEYAARLSNNRVITFQGHVYNWFPHGVQAGPGQANLDTL